MPRRPRVEEALDLALGVPDTAVRAAVDGVRRAHPEATPAEVIALLERRYLLAAGASGGAVGAVASLPVIGTGAAVALTAGQLATFLAASAVHALAVAEVHGIATEDRERRRALLLTALLGERGPRLLEEQLGISSLTWGRALLTRMPVATVRTVDRVVRKRLVAATAGRTSSALLGRLLPLGLGALIGYHGARMMGGSIIAGVREAFGPAPDRFSRVIEGGTDDTARRPPAASGPRPTVAR
jgi:hypothetical protein